ncbi:MAG: hypothetical protein U0232_30400 [Thermomicrobiales bacterium]
MPARRDRRPGWNHAQRRRRRRPRGRRRHRRDAAHRAPGESPATRGYGARVVILHGDVFDDAQQEARRLQAAEGLAYVPLRRSRRHRRAGTVALEILADMPRLGTLVVPTAAAAWIAGMASPPSNSAPTSA